MREVNWLFASFARCSLMRASWSCSFLSSIILRFEFFDQLSSMVIKLIDIKTAKTKSTSKGIWFKILERVISFALKVLLIIK